MSKERYCEIRCKTLEDINTLLVSAGSNPIKDYTVEYEDCSGEITPELIKELRVYI